MPADAVALLRRLVAIPSIAGADNRALIAEIGASLQAAGADVSVLTGTRAGAQVLHAVLGPADAPGGLLLAAHGDVVDVAGQEWSGDPFALRQADGRLYGRGTTDMKGFIACVLAAASSPSLAGGGSLRAPLHVAISHDEELGCAGVGPLLDRLVDGGAVPAPLAGVVVGEPTQLRVVERHKGKAAFRVCVRGRAAHSATPAAGVNAVSAAARVILALEELGRELADERSDPRFATASATVGIGPITGGVALNIVPERCVFELETRTLPEQDLDEIEARIRAVALAPRVAGAKVRLTRVAGYPPLAPDPATAALVTRVRRAGGEVADDVGDAVDFGTEAGLYRQRLAVPVVVCGPGSMAQGHTPDEFIEAGQLAAGEAFVARLIDGLRPSASVVSDPPLR